MNKQMTPREIELTRQSFVRLAPNKIALVRFTPISDKAAAALVGVESGPWPPPPHVPAAIASASLTMK